MRKYQELRDPNSCLNKADDQEILFVLRAKDLAAAATIRFWVEERLRLGLNKTGEEKIASALLDAHMMESQCKLIKEMGTAEKPMGKRSPIVKEFCETEDHRHYSDLHVMRSNAGWYIGTFYTDPENGLTEPGSRDSDYYPTKEAAQHALDTNSWQQRGHP